MKTSHPLLLYLMRFNSSRSYVQLTTLWTFPSAIYCLHDDYSLPNFTNPAVNHNPTHDNPLRLCRKQSPARFRLCCIPRHVRLIVTTSRLLPRYRCRSSVLPFIILCLCLSTSNTAALFSYTSDHIRALLTAAAVYGCLCEYVSVTMSS